MQLKKLIVRHLTLHKPIVKFSECLINEPRSERPASISCPSVAEASPFLLSPSRIWFRLVCPSQDPMPLSMLHLCHWNNGRDIGRFGSLGKFLELQICSCGKVPANVVPGSHQHLTFPSVETISLSSKQTNHACK